MNGCVERVHRSWREEVERWCKWESLEYLKRKNHEWLQYYNEERPHFGIDLLTPLQKFPQIAYVDIEVN
jgi:transposase InsO family protein